MAVRNWGRAVRLFMAAALLLTGVPLLLPWLPSGPLQPHLGAGADAAQEVPGEIVVDAKDSLTPAQLQDLDARYGLEFRYNSPKATDEKLLVTEVPVAEEAADLEKLRKDPLVEAAEPLHRYSASWTPNDPRFKEQWNLKLVHAEKAWDKTRGKGVTVAVIDTGVAFETDKKCYRAKDFGETRFTRGYDFVNKDDHPNDDHGHGTHVAGTIAESTDNGEGAAGLAFEATIMPLKVLDQFGSGTSADIADAVRFAADHGAKIINMSLGGPFPDQVMRTACQYAAKKGVLIVCAAGNSGGGPVGYPAGFPECLAVSAVGPTSEIAPYSSVGKEVAIAAPGGDKSRGEEYGILQNTVVDGQRESGDGYHHWQGTSMASPHVAAVAALAMSRGVKDPGEVRQLMERAATPKKPKTKYGAGVLNAAKTVDLADGARRDSLLKLLFTLLAGLTGVGVGAIRGKVGPLARFPLMPLGFALGVLGPDLVFAWLGFGSPFNIVLHSALIPLYLLWEADSRVVYRFVSAMGIGISLHLGWDAYQGHIPFAGIVPAHGIPWLWVNAAVGLGVALVAWTRSLKKP
jgi:serine protease